MSAPFKFKLKVKTGGDAGPANSQPSANAGPAADHPASQAPAKPFKLKLKVAAPAAAPAPPPAARAEDPTAQHWDAPHALPPPVGVKREAPPDVQQGAAPVAPRPIKKIKLATGKPAGVPVAKKPIIKFKAPPPKQPRDAAAAAAVDAGSGPALPIVRLTLPTVSSLPIDGGAKRLKPKGLKAGAKAGGGGGGGLKKARGKPGRPKAAAALSPDGGPAPRRAKRSRAELKELRDLGVDDLDDFEDDDVYNPDVPIAPRTFTLRSSHAAAAAAAPSSTGLGLSAGGPAPSDARTGAGGAAVADTAGTAGTAPAVESALPPLRPVSLPHGPVGPPKKEDFERLLTRCQKKDVHSMFKEPVTEAIAPGYFSVIKQPMDFSTMRAKAQRGEYDSWEALRADMRLMFSNALTYNAEGGNVYNYAKLLAGQCDRIVELAMQGKTDFRSSATITRKHNAAVRAQQRAEREALRAQARAEQRAAQEAKVLKKAGLASSFDDTEDENIRNSYRRPVRDPNVAKWKGLGAGCNAEGVAWGPGRQVLRPVNPWLPPGMYALSLARFAAGLKGKARELVLRRAMASTAADEAAERALQQELAKKVPVPPPPPAAPSAVAGAPAMPATAAAGALGAAAGNRLPAAVGLPAQQSAMQSALGAATAAAGSAAAAAAAPANMLAQQQLMMQAAVGRPPGMMGLAPGMPRLPPGATIQLMPTPQGMVPLLIQPGQPPMIMQPGMAAVAAAAGQKAGAAPGMPPVLMQPGFQAGFMPMPGMQPAVRPKQ